MGCLPTAASRPSLRDPAQAPGSSTHHEYSVLGWVAAYREEACPGADGGEAEHPTDAIWCQNQGPKLKL